MKKAISILLAALMLITLFSCASKNNDATTSESANPSAAPAASTDTAGTEEQSAPLGSA